MKIRYTYKAANDFRKLPREIQKRIAEKMRFYATQRDPLEFAKRLQDSRSGTFRYRIGDYRIIFDVTDEIIFILKIKKRDSAYE